MEYESVKEKLSGVTKDKRCKYSKFNDDDRYTTGKYAAIHGTAAATRKFKKLFPHYRVIESTVRPMRENYHRFVESPSSSSSSSSSSMKKLTSLKRDRPLLLGSLWAKKWKGF